MLGRRTTNSSPKIAMAEGEKIEKLFLPTGHEYFERED
jgi:hypothetical protein